jgi:protoporphyrinogen oxidase
MKIAIIGAGFTGLSAAYYLSKEGHRVTIFEAEKVPGGLAGGFKEPGWEWSLDFHYHHLFTSDSKIIKLASEVGHTLIRKTPISSTYVAGNIVKLDSPLDVLKFDELPLVDRLRLGIGLAFLKFTPIWEPLENITAYAFIENVMGDKVWKKLWGPLFHQKFGKYSKEISASWFWARIKKRSKDLIYPEGGFVSFIQKIRKETEKLGGKFCFSTKVRKVAKYKDGFQLTTEERKKYYYDKVIITLPFSLLTKIIDFLPDLYRKDFGLIRSLDAINLVLELKNKFFNDGTYWLNISDENFPFMGVIEHTNSVDKIYYGGKVLVYVGNYLPREHRYFKMTERQLFSEFYPHLKKINPRFNRTWVEKIRIFKAPLSQPVFPLGYSKIIPPIRTTVSGLYIANMEMVYPWDRGTNYAVELGEKVAKLVDET